MEWAQRRIAELERQLAEVTDASLTRGVQVAKLTAERDEARKLVWRVEMSARCPWVQSELPNLDADFERAVNECHEAVKQWEGGK
jgi:hypothetical protein